MSHRNDLAQVTAERDVLAGLVKQYEAPAADFQRGSATRGSADIRVKIAHKIGFHPLHQ
ncbi:hypothetical protein L2249_03505 [Xanthomonas perforans]|jgi:hypothetical protein|uniref:hypothetical protein n=1 Tax=Xanthomonas perforans TaxID=442694 RepID=UPI000AE5188E|nr:hypothetical protein [Xanthomonas perforans]MCF5916769.1 hypothetical protein [Xanthomonas perforans]MCF5922685.1 hypothetical protein [Xanthomonas perforans]MCF5925560.1 hypothetical protein [Xanthomonas perforans]MCF5931216.1 hypothetical protein [Xanthomonas perforans]MCF5939958.1 hypothetical protein [Xanthomonas perforans]